VRIREGVGGSGDGWFTECVSRRVWDGAATYFWCGCWCGGTPLRDRFRRLYDLADNKAITVRDMFLLGWEDGGEAWRWRCSLWVWEEEMLAECRELLHDVPLQDTTSDMWQWHLDPIGRYSICGVYDMLTSQEYAHVQSSMDLIWHKQVPLKVSIYSWRLLRDRLPTKSNLVIHGVIPAEAQLCVAECQNHFYSNP
jgi:hypothetical protein